jgi:ferritin-like metal-binding protein YciE
MSKLTTPRDLLVVELQDLYSAETQLTKALPKMAEAADSEELKAAFTTHLEQTEVHATRLEEIMSKLGESPKGKKCKAMEGLIKEASETMEQDAEPGIMDLALITAAQKVEHYEIAGYGCARTLAELAGEEDIAAILQLTLDEEGATDQLLTEIAMETDLGVAAEEEN